MGFDFKTMVKDAGINTEHIKREEFVPQSADYIKIEQNVKKDDLNKVVAALAEQDYQINLDTPLIEKFELPTDHAKVTTEVVNYSVTKDGKALGNISQIKSEEFTLTLAVLENEQHKKELFAVNFDGELVHETSENIDELKAQIDLYALCKEVCSNVCGATLEVTMGACIEACLETGPGEIICAPLCIAMQYATCSLGCPKICSPFK
ncbi:hypothetical protein D0U04_14620 [Bacillus clarus]|uniref:Uncharacterized protein n=1 Tax=Bacillus clarus TaxID=2338372 RepID=A0A090YL24_9BACI|nr:hypothetical protein [Bacillus clarus]KFM99149.1 hypothetical protein DJ93_3564 [Bacillus clarus]RFT66219.1 hypothetical protein D0U04_14620 [Bacillus clarus]